MGEVNEALRDRVAKLLALAERGVGGEAENARVALDAVLQRNGMVLEDIMDERRTRDGFAWKGEFEKKLLTQIMVTVCGVGVTLFTRKDLHNTLLADVTKGEGVEIELLFSAHRKQLKKEMELLFTAYVHKQQLFPRDGKTHDNSTATPEDLERIKRVALMMMGLQTVTVRRQLGGG
jgi:hypothetical protein